MDSAALAPLLAAADDWPAALRQYEGRRLKATASIVLANREIAPDAILRVVDERTGGKPFQRIEDVISPAELAAWQDRYRKVAGFSPEDLNRARA